MATKLRLLGVTGKNAPTKRNKTVQASDFNIGSIIGKFERAYDRAYEITSPEQLIEIFGLNITSTNYGYDVVESFFNNLSGQEGSIYVKSHVGFDGSSVDGVVANATITDQNGLASMVTLLSDLLAKYDVHDDDAELGVGWSYHAAQEASDHTPTDVTAPKTLDDIITKVNDLKSKYNAHDADGTAHGVASSHQTAVADATDMTTAIALINDLKTQYEAHRADAAQHTNGADNTNTITAGAASETPASTLKLEAAYKEELEYGISGNRTGYKIVNGVRSSTLMAATTLVSDTEITVDSAIIAEIGDIILIRATGATPGVVLKEVTEIDEANNKLKFSGAIGVTCQLDDVVEVPGFKIETYRKSITGIINEVETELGDSWCTMQSTVAKYYVENVHAQNKWIKASDQSSGSTLLEIFPDEVSTMTLLTSGSAGTSPTTAAHWSRDLEKLNNLSVRFICNPESTAISIQKAGEIYCKSRTDTPIWIATLAEDQTKSQLITIGAGYQRSDDVFQVNVAEWLKIDDSFNTAPNSPDRVIPNVGAVMGAWIRTIALLGVHYIPAVPQIPIVGINGISNDNLGDIGDRDRTDLAEYGINIIQFVQGQGYRMRNLFTPSTDVAFQFANGILMRNYIKISSEDSLQTSENSPNSFNRIIEDKEAIRQFLYKLWYRGSTGNVPEGETFGQQIDADGNSTFPEDHFQVTADAINNPQSEIDLGQRTIDVIFTYPTPAGSIQINVGILLRA